MVLPSDLQNVISQLEAAEADARTLVIELDEQTGTWRESPDGWSVAICLDHIALANRVYIESMTPAVADARANGKVRRSVVKPGFFGGLFARSIEPPVKKTIRMKAPRKIVPRSAVALDDALPVFLAAQQAVRDFICSNADLDLASIRFPNPFVRGLTFSVASGLFIITAHTRRHLWQAGQIRERARQRLAAKVA